MTGTLGLWRECVPAVELRAGGGLDDLPARFRAAAGSSLREDFIEAVDREQMGDRADVFWTGDFRASGRSGTDCTCDVGDYFRGKRPSSSRANLSAGRSPVAGYEVRSLLGTRMEPGSAWTVSRQKREAPVVSVRLNG